MKYIRLLACSFIFALQLAGDGVVTVQPTPDPVASWQFVGIVVNSTPPFANVAIVWLTESGAEAQLDPILYPRSIVLTGAELLSFIAAVSPAGTDTFSATGNAAKRFRQRAAKWLIDNGKLTRGANES